MGKKTNKVQMHRDICAGLSDLYERKNHDYGDSFHETFMEEGLAMSRIRLSDKLNRFKKLSKSNKAAVKDESIEDTLLDLANYAIMTVIELKLMEASHNATQESDAPCPVGNTNPNMLFNPPPGFRSPEALQAACDMGASDNIPRIFMDKGREVSHPDENDETYAPKDQPVKITCSAKADEKVSEAYFDMCREGAATFDKKLAETLVSTGVEELYHRDSN